MREAADLNPTNSPGPSAELDSSSEAAYLIGDRQASLAAEGGAISISRLVPGLGWCQEEEGRAPWLRSRLPAKPRATTLPRASRWRQASTFLLAALGGILSGRLHPSSETALRKPAGGGARHLQITWLAASTSRPLAEGAPASVSLLLSGEHGRPLASCPARGAGQTLAAEGRSAPHPTRQQATATVAARNARHGDDVQPAEGPAEGQPKRDPHFPSRRPPRLASSLPLPCCLLHVGSQGDGYPGDGFAPRANLQLGSCFLPRNSNQKGAKRGRGREQHDTDGRGE